MGITGNKSSVRKVIAALVLIAVVAGAGVFSCEANAQERSSVSLGQPLIGRVRCSFESLTVAREFWQQYLLAGINMHGAGRCGDDPVDANLTGFAIILLPIVRRLDIGFGASIREHGDIAVGNDLESRGPGQPLRSNRMQLTGAILIRSYWINRRLTVDFPMHFSSGGSTTNNRGLDVISLGYRF